MEQRCTYSCLFILCDEKCMDEFRVILACLVLVKVYYLGEVM